MNFIKKIYYQKYSKKSYSISNVDLIIDRLFRNNKKGIYLDIEKLMTQTNERKIKEIKINIFVPEMTSNETINFMKKASEDCPVTRNLSQEIDIKVSWHQKGSKNL